MALLLGFLLTESTSWANEAERLSGPALLKKYCSQCHGPPTAKNRQSGHWKNVILRMQNHRLKRGFKLLSEIEINALILYLNQNN